MKKRISILLVLCMLLSALPFAAAAASREPVTYSFANATPADAHGTVEANGTVLTDDAKFAEGTEITVTFTAEKGYVLKKYTITDSNGANITLQDGKFTMPKGSVVITAEFVSSGDGDYEKTNASLSITEQLLEFFRGIFQAFLIILIPFKDVTK